MVRRLISVVGILALTVAYLPGAVSSASASTTPDCCNGVMCPMHHMAGGQVLCDMGTSHSGPSLQSCPDNAQRYTAALAFVRAAPTIYYTERVISPATTFVSHSALNADLGVVLPPPRTSLT